MLSLGADTWHNVGDQCQLTVSSKEESELDPGSTAASDRVAVWEKVQQLEDGLSRLHAGHTRLVNVQVKTQVMQVQVAEYVEKRIHEHAEVWQSKIAEEIRRQMETTTASL